MTALTVIIGRNDYMRYTKPAVKSIKAVDPDLRLLVVDAGSKPKYRDMGVEMVRMDVSESYAAALNVGLRYDAADWYLLLNNDILFTKPISHRFGELDPLKYYGFKIWDERRRYGVPFISGWAMFVSHVMLEMIGDFDENLKPLWFEDWDYSVRAMRAGFPLVELDRNDWGVVHLEEERHEERVALYRELAKERHRNFNYVKSKHRL